MSTDHDGQAAVPLDGNAAAGLLRELFCHDVTSATFTCGGCGAVARVGDARLYGGPMGAIFRCAHCNTVVIRLVRTPVGFWLDMQGARRLLVPAHSGGSQPEAE
jgi:uncharacterized protein DUF6510